MTEFIIWIVLVAVILVFNYGAHRKERYWKLTRMASWDEKEGKWVEWDSSNYENGWKVPGKEDLDELKNYENERN